MFPEGERMPGMGFGVAAELTAAKTTATAKAVVSREKTRSIVFRLSHSFHGRVKDM